MDFKVLVMIKKQTGPSQGAKTGGDQTRQGRTKIGGDLRRRGPKEDGAKLGEAKRGGTFV